MDLTINKGTVTPTGATLQAKVGQPIVFRVATDEYGELLVGAFPDLRFGVDPRMVAPQVIQFTIDEPGVVDVTLQKESGCPGQCRHINGQDTTVATIDAQPAPAGTTSPAPHPTGLSRVPCELLTESIAKQFAGDDAKRQSTLDSSPKTQLGDDVCLYKSATRSVWLSINPVPTAGDGPLRHFHVIRPENRIPGPTYEAYWFAPGDSVVVIKNGLVLEFRVSDNPYSKGAQINQHRQAEDIRLADLIAPRVG